jgi:tetratricopeptide (TPR) repeat protein
LAWANKGPTSENLSPARSFFERALAVEPGNVDALVYLAYVNLLTATYLLTDDRVARLAAAEAGLIKALSIVPDHAFAHMWLGAVLGWTKRAEQGIAECERALAIDRNLAFAHAIIGMRKVYLGRPEDTEAHVQEALRLSPRDTMAHFWLTFVGIAKIYLGRPEEAVDWLRRSIQANRNNPVSHVYLAAALAIHGKLEEARATAGAALALNPRFTIDGFVGSSSFYDTPINNAGRASVVEGLRKAGMPEE